MLIVSVGDVESWYVSGVYLTDVSTLELLLGTSFDESSSPIISSYGYGYECFGEAISFSSDDYSYELQFNSLQAQAFNVESDTVQPYPDGSKLHGNF